MLKILVKMKIKVEWICISFHLFSWWVLHELQNYLHISMILLYLLI